jgi:hypothetical protein
MLKCGPSIFQPEWHSDKKHEWGDERCFYFIRTIHSDLVVPGVRIQKRQPLTPGRIIYYLIYAREREMILLAGPIDVFKIDTHLERIILLRHHEDVGEPLGVVHLSDELDGQESRYLLANRLALLGGRSSKVLFDGLHRRVDMESMLGQLRGNTRHVRRLPCEYVPVLTEELDELAFLLLSRVVEMLVGAALGSSGWMCTGFVSHVDWKADSTVGFLDFSSSLECTAFLYSSNSAITIYSSAI